MTGRLVSAPNAAPVQIAGRLPSVICIGVDSPIPLPPSFPERAIPCELTHPGRLVGARSEIEMSRLGPQSYRPRFVPHGLRPSLSRWPAPILHHRGRNHSANGFV